MARAAPRGSCGTSGNLQPETWQKWGAQDTYAHRMLGSCVPAVSAAASPVSGRRSSSSSGMHGLPARSRGQRSALWTTPISRPEEASEEITCTLQAENPTSTQGQGCDQSQRVLSSAASIHQTGFKLRNSGTGLHLVQQEGIYRPYIPPDRAKTECGQSALSSAPCKHFATDTQPTRPKTSPCMPALWTVRRST